MKNKTRFDLCDVIEQEIDDVLSSAAEWGEPIELDENRRSLIVLSIDKYLGEELHQQVSNALS
tara:strand:+ start:309 stop:497 length:189 start_codon:yes stop_codon:yes gene_type:complete